jgi:hypothetical protein
MEQQAATLPLPERPEARFTRDPAPGPADDAPRYRSARTLARATTFIFYLFIGTILFTAAADVYGISATNASIDGVAGAEDRLRTSDTLDVIAAITQGVWWLVLAVVFLVWFGRAYENLRPLGIDDPPRGTAWAIVSWFVPFVNWVLPVSSTNAIWRSGDTETPARTPWWQRPVSGLVITWWLVWASSWIAGAVANAMQGNAAELEQYRSGYVADLVEMGLLLAAALLAIAVVQKATRRQDARAEQIARGENVHDPSAPAPADEHSEFTIQPGWTPSDELSR